jgi:hypothetical protein
MSNSWYVIVMGGGHVGRPPEYYSKKAVMCQILSRVYHQGLRNIGE